MKAQAALEFITMMGLAMLVLVVIMAVAYIFSASYAEDKNIARLEDLGYSIQNELILASEVENGYRREFFVPESFGSFQYTISQGPRDLILTYKETDLLFPIPEINGTITTGTNVITKTASGEIRVNQ